MVGNRNGRFEVSLASLILLGIATIAATGVVFLLGIYVGKGVTEQRLAGEQRVVRLPVRHLEEPTKSGEVEVTFWDRLGKESLDREPAGGAPPQPTPTEPSIRVPPPAAAATPLSTPTASQPAAHAAARSASARSSRARSAPAPAPTTAAVAAQSTHVNGPLRGTYQVQVQALSDRSGAERLARDLRARGFDTRISPAKVGAQTLYRVRVGTFATEDQARQVVARLRSQGYSGAFLAAGAGD